MKAFTIQGTFKMGRNNPNQPFTKQFAVEDEAEARERIYSYLGSRQGVRRNNIHIKSVRETPDEEVQDIVVRHMLGLSLEHGTYEEEEE